MSQSRTPTAGAAYLAHRLGINATSALDRVRDVLPRAHPREEFVAALETLWG